MLITLEQFPLKYQRDDLSPFMSAQTIDFHYGKHLDTYIKNLNSLISGTKYENMSLDDIVVESSKSPTDKKIFNNAGQTWNHKMFFECMSKDNGSKMPDAVADAFDGPENFAIKFKEAAMSVFGSGWVWLSNDKGTLKIETTANADSPLVHGRKPLLTLDVWEHSYYLDYQNRRAEFVDAFLAHLIDWDFVAQNL